MAGRSLEDLEQINTRSTQDIKDAVYQKLKDMILKREFTPNERIDVVEITRKLGISRTPVRDALNMLDSEGFIKTVSRQGIYVKGIYKEDLIHLFQFREMIELFALDVGFLQLQEKWDELDAIHQHFSRLLSDNEYDGYEVMNCDIDFHKRMINATQNPIIITAYEKLNGHVQMARAYYLQDLQRINQANNEHQELIESIKVGNKKRAKEKLKFHLDQTLAGLLKMIEIYKVF